MASQKESMVSFKAELIAPVFPIKPCCNNIPKFELLLSQEINKTNLKLEDWNRIFWEQLEYATSQPKREFFINIPLGIIKSEVPENIKIIDSKNVTLEIPESLLSKTVDEQKKFLNVVDKFQFHFSLAIDDINLENKMHLYDFLIMFRDSYFDLYKKLKTFKIEFSNNEGMLVFLEELTGKCSNIVDIVLEQTNGVDLQSSLNKFSSCYCDPSVKYFQQIPNITPLYLDSQHEDFPVFADA